MVKREGKNGRRKETRNKGRLKENKKLERPDKEMK
jgi:hypothetical protein